MICRTETIESLRKGDTNSAMVGEQIASEVKRKIQQARFNEYQGLDVALEGDALILRGAAPSYHAKKVAQDIALSLGTRFRLVNNIHVN